jgi:hypothetical protein
MAEAEALKVGRAGGEIRTKHASIGTNMHIRNGRSTQALRIPSQYSTDTSTRAPLFFGVTSAAISRKPTLAFSRAM